MKGTQLVFYTNWTKVVIPGYTTRHLTGLPGHLKPYLKLSLVLLIGSKHRTNTYLHRDTLTFDKE